MVTCNSAFVGSGSKPCGKAISMNWHVSNHQQTIHLTLKKSKSVRKQKDYNSRGVKELRKRQAGFQCLQKYNTTNYRSCAKIFASRSAISQRELNERGFTLSCTRRRGGHSRSLRYGPSWRCCGGSSWLDTKQKIKDTVRGQLKRVLLIKHQIENNRLWEGITEGLNTDRFEYRHVASLTQEDINRDAIEQN